MSLEMNPEQRVALDARGAVFVSAGAGSGKTRVMVERFVEAVTDGGLDVSSILLVTFTERAAGELSARIRARLVELDRHDLARSLDGAWIHTIHGYCRRLLAAHPLRAGIDPRFRVLSAEHAAVLRFESFAAARRLFVEPDDPERWRVVTAYGADELEKMLFAALDSLRAAGRPLVLEPWPLPSLADALRVLREEAATLAGDPKVTAKQAEAAVAAVDVASAGEVPERLVELRGIRASGERARGFEEARKAVIAAAWSVLADRDRAQFQTLLDLFADCYARAKEREAAVDYADLELRARDLLQSDEALRRAERERFRLVMVDEFQDTNGLQAELLDLVTAESGADVLFVGDELQSIYGFRHADIAVYRERRAAAARVVELTLNYRSRPEVLDAVNEIFAGEFQDAFTPLVAAGEVEGQPGPRVEVLVTDGAAAEEETGEPGRRSEARHVARRIRELVDAGEATPGEIVLLFAKGPDASWFEEEIRASGLPVLRLTRADYWGQQQVADLLGYLRLLRNRMDDRALLTVLASPFVGVSNDALLLIRAGAERTPLWHGIDPALAGGLADRDRLLLTAFAKRYAELLEVSNRVSLEELCERIVVAHDYDLAILAQPDGERRFANIRKLVRLASEFESLRGPDLEGFVSFIADQAMLHTLIEDAVSLDEGADAVRLMTIHAAKGLEFPVVILADAGRGRPPGPRALCLADGRFGFKVADPVTGEAHDTPAFEAVRAVREAAARSEDARLQYVGMTRAMERLIVAGSIPKAWRGETPLRWLIDRLDLASAIESADGSSAVELERGRARVLLRVDRGQAPIPAGDAVPGEEAAVTEAQLVLVDAPENGLDLVLPPLADPATPPAHWPDRLSHSAIERFEKCPYRFFVEREGGLRDRTHTAPRPAAVDGTALPANERGSAVHRLLEGAVAERWREAPTDLEEHVRTWFPLAAPADLALIRAHVEAFLVSPLAARLAGASGVRVEQEFVLEHDGVLVNGRLDVLQRSETEALVLDFKTNALRGRDPVAVVETEYAGQRDLYALAALRAGAERVEVVYQFLEDADHPVVASFDRTHEPALASALSGVIDAIRTSAFPARPDASACRECPALGRVCRGTGGSLPVAAR